MKDTHTDGAQAPFVGIVVKVRGGKLYVAHGVSEDGRRAYFVQLREDGTLADGTPIYREYGPTARELNLQRATFIGPFVKLASEGQFGRTWKQVMR